MFSQTILIDLSSSPTSINNQDRFSRFLEQILSISTTFRANTLFRIDLFQKKNIQFDLLLPKSSSTIQD